MTRTFLAEVPVVPTLLALGRAPDERGRYFCPFHDDDRPGGHASAQVRDDPTVLTCWSCGAEASAPQLVAKVTGLPLRDALTWCLERVGSVPAVTPKPRPAPSPARLEAELVRQTTDIRYPGDLEPVAEFCANRSWGVEMMSYVSSGWGWVGDYRGRVVIPWRTGEGQLTGLRWRVPPDWRKDGRRGSQFRQLYGAWRVTGGNAPSAGRSEVSGDSRAPRTLATTLEVWITEGETDTVWAGYHLEPLGVVVLGVCTAAYRPRAAELELLAGARVVLALDGDDAGVRARERWRVALRGIAAETVVLELPAGEDLCKLTMTPAQVREKITA